MAKINLEEQLEANRAAAEHADTIRQTLESLEELRKKGITGRQYTLASPFGRRAQIPTSNQGKIRSLLRGKLTLGA